MSVHFKPCLKKVVRSKKKRNRDEVKNAVKEISLCKKRTLRDLAAAQGMSSTTVFRMKK
jgi:hypothetical protein